ncbi:MAG: NifB/NifX family molybdenum-iron cluster-binding protein [Thermoplasmataceae archaeon]
MKVAIAVDGDIVSGPGEAAEVRIYDLINGHRLIESYENPALTAKAAKGIIMLKSALDRGAESIIVSGIGQHAFTYTSGRLRLFLGNGMTVDQALSNFESGKLHELTGATHDHGNHEQN